MSKLYSELKFNMTNKGTAMKQRMVCQEKAELGWLGNFKLVPLVTNILKCDGKVEAIDSFTSFMQLSKRHYFPYSIATQTGVAVTHFCTARGGGNNIDS